MADDIKLSGLGMIEASAGTGKTYTIQDLFFKLIAGCSEHPEGFPLESILVVTFTEAATMELKERIRQILTDGLMFFENPELLRSGPDPEEKKENGESEEYRRIKRLLEEARPGSIEDGKTRKTVELRIRKALISFDDAMIFTIHGFCQRMLQQYAFDSGILFDTEFCNDASIVDGLQDDFLRQELYPEKSALHQALLGGKSAILDAKLCRCVISRADLKLTETGCLDPREILNELETKLKELRDDFSPDKLPPEADEARTGFEDWCRAEGDIADSTTESVLEMLQRVADDVPAAPDESSFMENIHAVSFLKKKFLRILRYQAAVLIRDRFEKLKQKDNFQTFDDLLYRMKRALTGPGSQSMLAAIRKQFNAVFVDEFQDTDPVQYEIFKTLFGDPATGHILFFVGDPKQAIYSFRGGDIATYRKAKEYIVGNAGNICSLSRNFRSASLLVKSVNRLFSLWQPPEGTDQTVFADKDIPFKEVASGKAISTLTSADGKTDPNPLKFCWVEKAPGDETPKDHEKTLMKLCVRHIEKLLDSGWMIPGDAGGKKKPRPLHPGDIAVLVPENSDAILFRTLLNKRNIPCIVTKSENVFYTPAAKYLQTVLSAVLDYSDRRLNMEVMTTPLLGFPPEQVRDFCLDGNNSEFDRIQAALMRLNLIW